MSKIEELRVTRDRLTAVSLELTKIADSLGAEETSIGFRCTEIATSVYRMRMKVNDGIFTLEREAAEATA